MDYSRALATVNRQIKDKGRAIRLTRYNSGNEDAGAAPNAAPTNVDTTAVFVHPTSLGQLGISASNREGFKIAQQIALVPPVAGHDFKSFDIMKDGLKEWTFTAVELLQPGDVQLLWIIAVRSA